MSAYPAVLLRQLEARLAIARRKGDHIAEVMLEQRIRELLREPGRAA